MRTSQACTMSNLCLTWINQELQKEVDRREFVEENEPTLVVRMTRPMLRMKAVVIAGLSGLSPFVAKFFG